MIISLLGYMGSGKSHIATVLGKKTGLPVLDLDKEIAKRLHMPLPEVFQKYGEIFFRTTEKEMLEEILANGQDAVLSLGGGTPAYFNNIEILNQRSITVYLRTGVATLAARLLPQKNKRPLIARIPDDSLAEFIAKHLFERKEFYAKAQFTLDTDGKNPEEISEEIMILLRKSHY